MKFLLLLLLTASVNNAYKILVYSAPLGYSHLQFMGQIADILQDAGHDVTVLHPVGIPKYLHAVSKSTKQILIDLPEKIQKGLDPKNYNVWDMNSKSAWRQISMLNYQMSLQVEACDWLLGDNQTIAELKKAKFDVGISEIIGQCGLGLFEQLGLDHMIGTSSVGLIDSMAELYDAPRLPSFVPSYLLPISAKMNFLERTMNFITSLLSDIAIKGLIVRKHEEVFARHGVLASEDDFYHKTNYLLSNSDEFLEDARPITAKIIHIGGIALSGKAQLNNEFQELMDRTDRAGAVYISFGSIVPTKEMPPVFREAIIHVAEAFPRITFIWKVDKDDSVLQLANLHTFAWLPQQALLDHPKLLCFVSHAGLNSVLEVTRSGKPSILVPIFGDQFR
ncbi:hypothetical protein OESDEN_12804 [Oesophagostomum dentatum]|uniref:glucuronosyltransferase n=1 Tax=Oesophagostomum dentatum TaxID=61180 RepID=A0A0B1SV51_OESDE|nr:hypothetical protein OESDEN_12804 [Oesophagostomum dentatum]